MCTIALRRDKKWPSPKLTVGRLELIHRHLEFDEQKENAHRYGFTREQWDTYLHQNPSPHQRLNQDLRKRGLALHHTFNKLLDTNPTIPESIKNLYDGQGDLAPWVEAMIAYKDEEEKGHYEEPPFFFFAREILPHAAANIIDGAGKTNGQKRKWSQGA